MIFVTFNVFWLVVMILSSIQYKDMVVVVKPYGF